MLIQLLSPQRLVSRFSVACVMDLRKKRDEIVQALRKLLNEVDTS